MIQVTVDAGRLPAQLAALQKAVQNRWWEAYIPVAETLLEREHREHFTAGQGPNGQTWKPLSSLTLELAKGDAAAKVGSGVRFTRTRTGKLVARGRGGKQKSATVRRDAGSRPLLDNGALSRSLTSNSTGSVRRKGKAYFDFGTALPYARVHQKGATMTVTAKQRAFLSARLGRWFTGKTITIPARPFLGVGAKGRMDLSRGARAVLNRVMREAVK